MAHSSLYHRAPVSIRKMITILSDPVVYLSITAAVTVAGVATAVYFYTGKQHTRVLDQHCLREFKLIRKVPLSSNTHVYRFALPRKDDVLGLPVGQHLSVVALIDGKEVVRSYTPTSSDENKGYFELIIKTYPNGTMSKHIGSLSIGEKISVRGPKGTFMYTPNMAGHIAMIAGGTGITPMIQIIRSIVNNEKDRTKVTLIFGNVSFDDILLRTELELLSQRHPEQLRVHHVLNTAPHDAWTGSVGFITKEVLAAWLPEPSDQVKILVCGPPPMVKAVTTATTELGFEAPRSVSKLTDQVYKF